MPYARRRWRNGGGVEACPRHVQRFLEPCLLLLVHCQEIHGYELADGLKPYGFERNPVDTSTIYRLLDCLVVDLPPGTSDASLTVMQSLPFIDVDECIECGSCAVECPEEAIVEFD